ncbi:PaaI family thioesterase [Ferrovibrio sp.]|uniref:PaaI family thioesterase n=1 Tax=Ferrovibrio sp. TaxID=1917215 RepID=UPI00311FC18F
MSAARIDPGLPAWAVSLAESLVAETAFHQWAGLRLLALAPGMAEVGFTAEGAMLVFGRYVHGGVLNGLLEPPGLLAMLGDMQESETAMTVDIHVQHIRSVLAGEAVTMTGRLLKRGRSTAFCAVEARVGGAVCTAARITKTIQNKAG